MCVGGGGTGGLRPILRFRTIVVSKLSFAHRFLGSALLFPHNGTQLHSLRDSVESARGEAVRYNRFLLCTYQIDIFRLCLNLDILQEDNPSSFLAIECGLMNKMCILCCTVYS